MSGPPLSRVTRETGVTKVRRRDLVCARPGAGAEDEFSSQSRIPPCRQRRAGCRSRVAERATAAITATDAVST